MSKSEILTKFETLATIPHCSYDTDKMRDFLASYAKTRAVRSWSIVLVTFMSIRASQKFACRATTIWSAWAMRQR